MYWLNNTLISIVRLHQILTIFDPCTECLFRQFWFLLLDVRTFWIYPKCDISRPIGWNQIFFVVLRREHLQITSFDRSQRTNYICRRGCMQWSKMFIKQSPKSNSDKTLVGTTPLNLSIFSVQNRTCNRTVFEEKKNSFRFEAGVLTSTNWCRFTTFLFFLVSTNRQINHSENYMYKDLQIRTLPFKYVFVSQDVHLLLEYSNFFVGSRIEYPVIRHPTKNS